MCHTTRRPKIASAHPPLVPRLETRLAATSLTFAARRPRASQVPLVTNALFLNRSPKGERSARTARIRAKRSARPHSLQALQTLSVARGGRVRGRACEARRERAEARSPVQADEDSDDMPSWALAPAGMARPHAQSSDEDIDVEFDAEAEEEDATRRAFRGFGLCVVCVYVVCFVYVRRYGYVGVCLVVRGQ